ncbi:hypothetical protein [Streptomyces sp. NPDC049555]|uniref:hypothetical protein n=1 Tax=Streptomyces sp. NPDC049555 TaxID=3154930 RepID=UPI00341B18C9
MLWPKAFRDRIQGRGGQDVVQSYPYRSACPSTVWGELIAGAREELFLGGYTSYFLWTQVPELPGVLRRKAATGCRVRQVGHDSPLLHVRRRGDGGGMFGRFVEHAEELSARGNPVADS